MGWLTVCHTATAQQRTSVRLGGFPDPDCDHMPYTGCLLLWLSVDACILLLQGCCLLPEKPEGPLSAGRHLKDVSGHYQSAAFGQAEIIWRRVTVDKAAYQVRRRQV